MFTCKCGETDPSNFYKTNKSKCKVCVSAAVKQRYHNLSEADKRAYRQRSKLWQDNNIFKYRTSSAYNRAKRRGLKFDIDEQFVQDLYKQQNGKCYYTKYDLSLSRDDRKHTLSLDRLDSNLGYTRDNVVLCCACINTLKSDSSIQELYDMCEAILSTR